MFFRLKKSGERSYVQIVENKREGAAVRQTVIANLGRADELAASGALASLLASGAKLTDQVLVMNALEEDAEGAQQYDCDDHDRHPAGESGRATDANDEREIHRRARQRGDDDQEGSGHQQPGPRLAKPRAGVARSGVSGER